MNTKSNLLLSLLFLGITSVFSQEFIEVPSLEPLIREKLKFNPYKKDKVLEWTAGYATSNFAAHKGDDEYDLYDTDTALMVGLLRLPLSFNSNIILENCLAFSTIYRGVDGIGGGICQDR